jgi:two-component system CheB/CheR fusion protein
MDELQQAEPPDLPANEAAPFQVVGIGASAGGLPALMALLENMPAAPGMALVIVLHLAPDHPSAADKLLQRATAMPVVQVSQRMSLRPNQVYVISPGRSLRIQDKQLIVDEQECALGIPITINIFLRTLAEAHGPQAIGVILSGMGSDGVAGLASIKEHGGVTIAQLPGEAEESSMPQAAIDSGMVDFVLPAAQVPAKLIEMRDAMGLIRRRRMQGNAAAGLPPFDMGARPQQVLDSILALLCARSGHDFRHYKQPTILRRVECRMQVRGVPDLPAYHQLLQDDLHEAQALLHELLIGVTTFFRDRDAFKVLEQTILPRIFHDRPAGTPLRAWVTACSTGEEAYSLGMLLAEHAESIGGAPAMQIFATDVDERAIAVARAGRYPDAIAADVPAARLARYFMLEDDHFRVRRLLRDRILFAPHDLLHDPAFSNLDLITCRNVLIYLNREVHRHVLEIFHSALVPGGYLFLGGAESADLAPDLFVPVNTRHRLYQAKPAAKTVRRLSMLPAARTSARPAPEAAGADASVRETRLSPFADIRQRALARLAPPSLLLNARAEVVDASEHAARFLRYGGGEPSAQVLALVLPELRTDLRAALLQAQTSGQPAASGPVRYRHEDEERVLRLSVLPLENDGRTDGMMLVQFEAAGSVAAAPPAAGQPADPKLAELEEALAHARQNLQRTIEHADAAGAGQGRVIDALRDTIDDLRASIDDLEGEREELQSRNEELYTVNVELELRVEETAKANDDLSNLIASTDIATLFLDPALRIQRYTPHVTRIFNIIAADVGRPLAHITSRLQDIRLFDEVAGVFANREPIEREVHTTDGRDYILRVHPYRTGYDRIEGVVMTFFDITRRRIAENALRESEERFRAFVTASSDMLYKMSADWSEMRNLQGKNILADTEDPTCSWIEKYIPEDDRPQVLAVIAKAIETRSTFELEHRVFRADGEIAWTFSRAIPLLDGDGEIVEWFGAGSDITERKRGEEALRAGELRLAEELEKTRLLQRLSTSLIPEQRPEALHEPILDAAITLTRADAATIQLLDPHTGRLRLIASRNIHPQSQAFWQEIDGGHASACGQFLRTHERVMIEDAETDLAMAGTGDLEEFRRSGLRAVQSTPLKARSGRLIGLISTHWHAPRRLVDDDFRLFDVLARQLADLIERAQVDEASRANAERHRADLERQVQERTAELKRSHDLLQATMDASSDMIQVFEAVRGEDGAIVDFRWVLNNATAETAFGKVEGQRLLERNPGVVATGIFDTLRQVAETGTPHMAERHYTHEQFNGWFLQSVVRLGDGVATTTKDITGWKAAQDEVLRLRDEVAQASLRESEAKYRDLIDFIPAAVYACNADATLAYYNERAVALWGRTPGAGDLAWDLFGFPRSQLPDGSPVAPRESPLAGVLATGEPVVNRELSLERPDGSTIDILVNITALRDGTGQITGAINIFQDITERKHAEAAVRESEARFRALAEASPALIWQVDSEGNAAYLNQRYLDVTGIAQDALRGSGWHAVLHPGDAAAYLAACRRTLDEQSLLQQRVRLRMADGSHHWFASHALPWYAADGQFRGLVGISIDVNEAVEAEDALRTADRRKDEFVATLAHELRNPLAPISNALQFLRRPDGRRNADRLMQMVERQVRQMVRLVDDLMEVTRISRGKVDLHRAPVALAEVLNSAVETSQPGFDQKGQQLGVALPGEALVLDADKLRLTQVFANLLNNAAKYTAPGGQVWLDARREGREVVVSVRDTGMGIPEEQLPTIFDMFSQPHGRDGHSDSGLGIGLAMVRSLVEMHGGTVQAQSEGVGKGSEFVVRLPLHALPGAVPGDEAAAEENAALLAGQRILVVDDNRDAADSLCHLLAARGADARALYDGRSAIEALESTQPHAIVLDIGMPGMDGYQVAQQIRQDKRAEGIQIVALSGWGQHADRVRSRACGFDHHLTKPAELQALLKILAN